MILTDKEIKELIEKESLIENYTETNIQSSSYDISIIHKILIFKKIDNPIELNDKKTLDSLYEEVDITDGYELKPGECVLAVLKEKINMPENLCAHIRPRTSLSRIGINIHFQQINPWYSGTLNIQLFNVSPNTFIIKSGLKIGQIVFEELASKPLGDGYNDRKYKDENGLRGSRIYEDFNQR